MQTHYTAQQIENIRANVAPWARSKKYSVAMAAEYALDVLSRETRRAAVDAAVDDAQAAYERAHGL
jgi:hypothetical protein